MIAHTKRPAAGALAVVAALAAAVVVARPALGYGGRVLSPSDGQVVTAGEIAVVRWSALAPDVEELELLLSLDGGRSYSLRLTPQLAPGSGSFHWLVPNLPTEHARIRVRYGRRGAECDAEAGGVFRIVGASLPTSAVRYRAGEWWTGSHAPRDSGGLEPHEDRVHRPDGVRILLEPGDLGSPQGRPRTPVPDQRPREAVEREPSHEGAREARSARPLDLPQRE